jgi:hypothetical protein
VSLARNPGSSFAGWKFPAVAGGRGCKAIKRAYYASSRLHPKQRLRAEWLWP